MKFLFASDSFKGTLSSARIAELLTTAAKESFPDCTCTSIETADGCFRSCHRMESGFDTSYFL